MKWSRWTILVGLDLLIQKIYICLGEILCTGGNLEMEENDNLVNCLFK